MNLPNEKKIPTKNKAPQNQNARFLIPENNPASRSPNGTNPIKQLCKKNCLVTLAEAINPKKFSGKITADNAEGDRDIFELSSKLTPVERIDSFIKVPVGISCIAERPTLNSTTPENMAVREIKEALVDVLVTTKTE